VGERAPAPLDEATVQALAERIHSIPISSFLKMELVEARTGTCTVRVPRDPRYDGVFESFHGGILMTIADSVACYAVLTLTGPDQALTTTDMNIRFLAPCLSDVRAEARVIKHGRTLCPVSVDLFDEKGAHVAVAQVNYMLLPKIPGRRG